MAKYVVVRLQNGALVNAAFNKGKSAVYLISESVIRLKQTK